MKEKYVTSLHLNLPYPECNERHAHVYLPFRCGDIPRAWKPLFKFGDSILPYSTQLMPRRWEDGSLMGSDFYLAFPFTPWEGATIDICIERITPTTLTMLATLAVGCAFLLLHLI